MRLCAQDLKVKYQFVETNWGNVIGDLTGQKVKPRGTAVEVVGAAPVKGSHCQRLYGAALAGKIVDFSTPVGQR